MELHFVVYCATVVHFGNKEHLGKACVLRHGVHHSQSCYSYTITPIITLKKTELVGGLMINFHTKIQWFIRPFRETET